MPSVQGLASRYGRTFGDMKRILLLGGSGQLGTALRAALAGHDVTAPPHSAFDAVTGNVDQLLVEYPCDVLINCAAFVNVDRSEREAESAFALNAAAVDRLAAAAAKHGAVFVTISTDYVFSGEASHAYREDDAPAPGTVYGVSKVAGEMLARRHSERHYIIRTSAVFGTVGTSNKGYTLIDKVLDQAARGEPTRMVNDVTFSPSYAPHVARAIRSLIDAEAFGTHHVTNTGSCTWFEFVQTAFAKAGLAAAPLEPISYASFGNPTPRPKYSPLENTTFARLGIEPLPPWQEALDEYLIERAERLANAFQCNVCGERVTGIPIEELHREGGACPACGANVRLRAIAHLASLALTGSSLPVTQWPRLEKRAMASAIGPDSKGRLAKHSTT